MYYVVTAKTGASIPGIRINGKRHYKEILSVFLMTTDKAKAEDFMQETQRNKRHAFDMKEEEFRVEPMEMIELSENSPLFDRTDAEGNQYHFVVKMTGRRIPGAVSQLGTPVYKDDFEIEKVFMNKREAAAYMAIKSKTAPKNICRRLWSVELDGEPTISLYWKKASSFLAAKYTEKYGNSRQRARERFLQRKMLQAGENPRQ